MGLDWSTKAYGKEDCLTVDVIAPTDHGSGVPKPSGTFPVQVWMADSTTDPSSNKDDYYATSDYSFPANQGKAITVVVKYRVGIFGFMSHPALRTSGAGSNRALQDVQFALKWVRQNIGSFGGDPQKVTIQGSGPGSNMVIALLASPKSYDEGGQYPALFTGAILSTVYAEAVHDITYSQKMQDAFGEIVAFRLGCATTTFGMPLQPSAWFGKSKSMTQSELETIKTCLSQAPVDANSLASTTTFYGLPPDAQQAFVTEYGQNADTFASTFYAGGQYATVDAEILPNAPLAAFMKGVAKGVSIVVGHNTDEAEIFWPADQETGLVDPTLLTLYQTFYLTLFDINLDESKSLKDIATRFSEIKESSPSLPAAVTQYYSALPYTDGYQRQTQMLLDAGYVAPLDKMLGILSSQVGRVAGSIFRYIFAQGVTGQFQGGKKGPWAATPFFGATHGAQFNYLWGTHWENIDVLGYAVANELAPPFSASANRMGATLKAYLSSFIATGTPNSANLPTWSPLEDTVKPHMVFQADSGIGALNSPCALFTSCLAEPTADFRSAQSKFWLSGGTITESAATCSTPMVGLTHTPPFEYSCNINVTRPVYPSSTVVCGPGTVLNVTTSTCDITCASETMPPGRRLMSDQLFGQPTLA
jgi:carboxylesterase type B